MALKAGRKGLKDTLVDAFGNLKKAAVDSFLSELKADIEEEMEGWSEIETLATYDYGVLKGRVNTYLDLAVIEWTGNATTATAGTQQVALTGDLAKYVPVGMNYLNVLRNADSIEVRTDGKIYLRLTAEMYGNGTIVYPIK